MKFGEFFRVLGACFGSFVFWLNLFPAIGLPVFYLTGATGLFGLVIGFLNIVMCVMIFDRKRRELKE